MMHTRIQPHLQRPIIYCPMKIIFTSRFVQFLFLQHFTRLFRMVVLRVGDGNSFFFFSIENDLFVLNKYQRLVSRYQWCLSQ